ncbi:unnamed protein product [Echinostoma caproni]|uniref:RING-type E3 ubiquitin transferase n=1 Tax=Echinostoma caproni TaxID=27848 RepID=A0A183B6Z3_9TREM|nr:unnamed protein product [Echinostoma caproni]
MIMLPLHIYLQRLIATYSIWGILIVLMLWLPLEVIRRTVPGFLPYQINVAHESPLDYSVEIILIQVVLPFLLDAHAKANARQWLRGWCILVSWLLNIRSFLLGDVPLEPGDSVVNENGQEVAYTPPGTRSPTEDGEPTTSESGQPRAREPQSTSGPSQGTAAIPLSQPQVRSGSEHQPQANEPPPPPHMDEDADEEDFTRFVPYKRTSFFTIRLCGFLVCVLISLMLLSTSLLVIPVGLGRFAFSLISSKNTQKHDAVALVAGFTLLGVMLRVASYVPDVLRSLRQSLSAFVLWSSRLFCWSRRLHVLRIWTRSGTTCEIAIPRPALPAPIRTTAGSSSGPNTATFGSSTYDLVRACNERLCIVCRLVLQASQLFCLALLLLVLLPVALGLLINLVFITPFQVAPRKTLIFGFWEVSIANFVINRCFIRIYCRC